MTIEIRASKTTEVERCAAAAQPTQVRINRADDESRLGSAAHDALQQHGRGMIVDLEEIARVYQVNLDDLQELFSKGCRIWEKYSVYFPKPEFEQKLTTDFGIDKE